MFYVRRAEDVTAVVTRCCQGTFHHDSDKLSSRLIHCESIAWGAYEVNISVRHTNIIFIDYNITKYADMQSNVSDIVTHKGKLKRLEKDTLYFAD